MASRDAGKLRLWAVDLSICPTASLSGFQLFDFLAAGQFDSATGTYWVPGMPETPDLQQSEAADSACAVDSQLHEGQSILQPFEQDAVAVQEQSSSYRLPVQSTEGDSDHEAQEQSSTADHRPLSSMGVDGAQAEEGRQNAAVRASTAASSDAAKACLMTHSQDDDLEFDLAEAGGEGECAANAGYSQEQVVAEVASMSHQQTTQQLHADSSGVGAAVWQQPAGSAESATVQHEVQLEPRFYAAIDLLFHSGMHKRRSAEFLQNCRVAGLGFDMMARQGLVLNFMDSMSSCCLGMQCGGPTPQLALQGLCKVMAIRFYFVSLPIRLLQLLCIHMCHDGVFVIAECVMICRPVFMTSLPLRAFALGIQQGLGTSSKSVCASVTKVSAECRLSVSC